MKELTIFIFDAEEGMELSRDVILNDGSVLLTKGTVLNLDLISRISGHHILEISVYDKTAADSAIDNRTISSISAVPNTTKLSVIQKNSRHLKNITMNILTLSKMT